MIPAVLYVVCQANLNSAFSIENFIVMFSDPVVNMDLHN